MINGVLCHETGCPDAWRDSQVECKECGVIFHPHERGERICPDCWHEIELADAFDISQEEYDDEGNN